jgi:hypothetical protein
MTYKEPHQIGHRAGSLEGCWKLAGDNIPGHRAVMTPRPGGAPEKCKPKQGMEAQSSYERIDSHCGPILGSIIRGKAGRLHWLAGAARKNPCNQRGSKLLTATNAYSRGYPLPPQNLALHRDRAHRNSINFNGLHNMMPVILW